MSLVPKPVPAALVGEIDRGSSHRNLKNFAPPGPRSKDHFTLTASSSLPNVPYFVEFVASS